MRTFTDITKTTTKHIKAGEGQSTEILQKGKQWANIPNTNSNPTNSGLNGQDRLDQSGLGRQSVDGKQGGTDPKR